MILGVANASRNYYTAGKYSKNRTSRIAMSQQKTPSKKDYAKNPTAYRSQSGQNISGRKRLNKTQRSTLNRKERTQYKIRRNNRQTQIVSRVGTGVAAVGLANQMYRLKTGNSLPGLRGISRSFKVKGRVRYTIPGMNGNPDRIIQKSVRIYGANFSTSRGGSHSYFQPKGFGNRLVIRVPNRIAMGKRPQTTMKAISKRNGGMRTSAVNARRTFTNRGGRVRRDYKGRFAGWY